MLPGILLIGAAVGIPLAVKAIMVVENHLAGNQTDHKPAEPLETVTTQNV